MIPVNDNTWFETEGTSDLRAWGLTPYSPK